MNSHPLTLEEELSIRAHADEAWQMTWSKATGLDAKRAFIEGFCMAFTMGVIAVKATTTGSRRRENYQSITISLLMILVGLLIYF